ncbi:hypothetical protein RFI_18018, partial [Reticulomyxa filosa]
LKEAYERVTSRDPTHFWTSGQWMTERGGGSDVSNNGTKTIAKVQPDGIACFFLRVKNDDGTLNHIRMVQLKDKFGTRQLPTAELELKGTKALIVSKVGRGVPFIMEMANVTRIHNTISSVSAIQNVLLRCREFAKRRHVHEQLLAENIHCLCLCNMQLCCEWTLQFINYGVIIAHIRKKKKKKKKRASLNFMMDVIVLLGKSERSTVKEEKSKSHLLLRLLTPIVKMYTGKACVAVASEGIESLGGI